MLNYFFNVLLDKKAFKRVFGFFIFCLVLFNFSFANLFQVSICSVIQSIQQIYQHVNLHVFLQVIFWYSKRLPDACDRNLAKWFFLRLLFIWLWYIYEKLFFAEIFQAYRLAPVVEIIYTSTVSNIVKINQYVNAKLFKFTFYESSKSTIDGF